MFDLLKEPHWTLTNFEPHTNKHLRFSNIFPLHSMGFSPLTMLSHQNFRINPLKYWQRLNGILKELIVKTGIAYTTNFIKPLSSLVIGASHPTLETFSELSLLYLWNSPFYSFPHEMEGPNTSQIALYPELLINF